MTKPTLHSGPLRGPWRFAAERHRIFECRVDGAPPPWTEDTILLRLRFCIAFRASDGVSPYLI